MKVIIVVGHSKEDQGARNSSYGVSEFVFNEALALDIKKQFGDLFNFNKHEIVIVYRENGLKELPSEINELKADLIVSLHCNAFNKSANGCEMLYYHKSEKGKEISSIFQNHLVKRLGNKDRGIKSRTVEDRGGYLLRYTNAPCIIVEPFFIDNDEEFLRADECFKNGDLTKWYCESIHKSLEFLQGLKVNTKDKYIVELDGNFEMTVEIKNDESTLKVLHEINNFWSGSKSRLSSAKGCIDTAVLKLIAGEVVRFQARTAFNEDLDSVLKEFNGGIEGYYPMDGSFGIEIIDIEIPFSPSDLDFDVNKATKNQQ